MTTKKTPEDVITDTLAQLGGQRPWRQWAGPIVAALAEADYEIIDTLPPRRVFTRDEVEAAWNNGAELVLQDGDLSLSDRDTDLVNLVCNAIGQCLDNPETDSLDDVILANYDPQDVDDHPDGMPDSVRVDIVKGWINQ
jgi:hypothetical protein